MTSNFKAVFLDKKWSDDFYRFLQIIFHLYPEDKFHYLISEKAKEKQSDEEIYNSVQGNLSQIKPFLADLTLALPALKKQKREMAKQVMQIFGNRKQINGYFEIGSTGRYISELRKSILFTGPIFLSNDIAPSNSIGDIFERGQFAKIGQFFPLDNYQTSNKNEIPDNSLDLITCHIGLHHCPLDLLDSYILFIHKKLRKGGLFILRDHDVKTPEMATFVSLVHTVFNLGLNVKWETDKTEFRFFRPIAEWVNRISSHGFKDMGFRVLQDKDPSDNTLISFEKI